MAQPAVISLELEVPRAGPVALTAEGVVHLESSIQDVCLGWSTAFHDLKTTDTEFVDKLLGACSISASPTLWFRLGLGSGGNYTWSPRQKHYLLNHRAVLQGLTGQSSYTVRLNTADPLWFMSKTTKVAARKGKISQVVEAIARENGLENPVIEPTEGDGLYVQNYCSDTRLILERLRLRAVNAEGRGNYQCYFKAGVFHFHTPDYQARVVAVNYFSGGNEDLVQADHSTESRAAGSGRLRLIAYDPYTGQTRTISPVPGKTLKLADSLPQPIPGLGASLSYHLSGNRPQEADQMAVVLEETERMQSYHLEMRQTGSVDVEKGDFVNLTIQSGASTTSPWSGLYYVPQVNRGLLEGTLTSRIFLTRSETGLRNGGLPATGKSLNTRAVESSTLAKGGASGEGTVIRPIIAA